MKALWIAIGTLLSIIGIIGFIAFMWRGLWLGSYVDIVVCVVFLFVAFGGGVLLRPATWKVGFYTTSFGLLGTTVFGVLAWVVASSIENAGVEYMGEFFFTLIFVTLAGIFLGVMVYGLGNLFGWWILPRSSKNRRRPQPPEESGDA